MPSASEELRAVDVVPPLIQGDRLTREEFELRYDAMPHVNKAELIEGAVFLGTSVSTKHHGAPHAAMVGWLGVYQARTPGVNVANSSTVRLDWDNEPQPDAFLRILPECGGQTRDDGAFVVGPPEFAGEVAGSSASYDLHDKKEAYRRNGVCEYLVWRAEDRGVL